VPGCRVNHPFFSDGPFGGKYTIIAYEVKRYRDQGAVWMRIILYRFDNK
jgi:hypothetical protein